MFAMVHLTGRARPATVRIRSTYVGSLPCIRSKNNALISIVVKASHLIGLK